MPTLPKVGTVVWVRYGEIECFWPCIIKKYHSEKHDEVYGAAVPEFNPTIMFT